MRVLRVHILNIIIELNVCCCMFEVASIGLHNMQEIHGSDDLIFVRGMKTSVNDLI